MFLNRISFFRKKIKKNTTIFLIKTREREKRERKIKKSNSTINFFVQAKTIKNRNQTRSAIQVTRAIRSAKWAKRQLAWHSRRQQRQ